MPGAPIQLLNNSLRPYLGALSEIEYSKQYGVTVNIGAQRALGDWGSALLQGRIGAKQRGLLGGIGFRLQDDLHLNLLGEHLQQRRYFDDADENYWVSQDKLGVGLQYLPKTGAAKLVGIRYAYTDSADKNLSDTILVEDDATLYEKYSIQNRFVGVGSQELQVEATFDIGEQGELALHGGPTYRRSNDGSDRVYRFNGGAAFTYYAGWAKLAMGARSMLDSVETKISAAGNLGADGTRWQLQLTHLGASQYNHSDTIFGLAINIPFGGSGKTASSLRPGRNASDGLERGLRAAARSFRSTVVAGQEKEVGRTRLLAIDKTGLPVGASVAASGIITVPLGVTALSIA